MKTIDELKDRHKGEDIYVVGSGASLRVFPKNFLEDKITIGLNMAWKLAPIKYGITIHPDLNIPDFMSGETARPGITWIVKQDKISLLNTEQADYARRNHYTFRTEGRTNAQPPNQPNDAGRFPEWILEHPPGHLYCWSSISQTAVHMAAIMGAKNIVLVGCDNAAISGNHHGHRQHTRWKGVSPDERYRQYWQGLIELRPYLRQKGVNLVSLTPFMALDKYEEEFQMLCDELGVEVQLRGQDISQKIGLKGWVAYFVKKYTPFYQNR
jgi:hypothetical protein